VRNAVFRRVELAARDDVPALAALERAAAERTATPSELPMTREAWDRALEAYYAEHDRIGTGPDARGPDLFHVEADGRSWLVRQTLDDPAGHRDWVVEARVDLDATDDAGEAVVLTTALRRLT
jgi:hypothetical protein